MMIEDDEQTTDLMKPCSASGNFWKSEYDTYKDKSARDVRRLIQSHRAENAHQEQVKTRLLKLVDIKDAHIMELQQKVARLEKSSDAARCTDTVPTTTTEMNAKLNAMNERLASTEDALARTREQLYKRDMNTNDENLVYETLQDSERRAEKLEDENRELKGMLAAVEDEIAFCQSQREAKFREREGKLQQIIQTLRQCLKERNLALAHLREERDDLRTQVSSVHKRLSILAMSAGLISQNEIVESIRRYQEVEGHIT